ncbi:MAG TPA: hypothetical protein PLJ21_00490 [Pseudobdellovibrionaceae bacterium]|nr:hypothetical protein [Pseudobdellovibrionaceae bacterium]
MLQKVFISLLIQFFALGSFARSISCDKINLQGSYKLKIDEGVFTDFSDYAEKYFESDYVRFSELIDTDTKIIQFYPENIQTASREGMTKIKTNVAREELQNMKAEIVGGVRGDFCSLEVSGVKTVNGQSVDFSEYYLILAINFKGENFFWLGHPNEAGKLVAYYKLTKMNSNLVALYP